MRIYNRFILTLVVALSAVTALMAVWRVDNLEIYLTAYIMTDLTTTTLFIYFNPRARRALGSIALVLFTGFMAIVVIRVLQILHVIERA